ncbi:MAG: GDCCVxC domain-containing (seleno)protein [Gracilimonas sp.]|nr:GDCCVxC domain-containing (seleno)protein [Gracilimonas sp.]
MELISVLTCPFCDHSVTKEMPEDACQYFWQCDSCGEILKPKPGDCCVYCSYGSVACPPKQADKGNSC